MHVSHWPTKTSSNLDVWPSIGINRSVQGSDIYHRRLRQLIVPRPPLVEDEEEHNQWADEADDGLEQRSDECTAESGQRHSN